METNERYHKAFTLVELLVVIAIVGVLMSLLLPAVNSVRESARTVNCRNNLRQMAIATHRHTQQYNYLPKLWRSNEHQPWQNFSWRVELLPYLEQDSLYNQLDFDAPPLKGTNATVVTVLESLQCPSTPGYPRRIDRLGAGSQQYGKFSVGASDYTAVFEAKTHRNLTLGGAWYSGPDIEMLPNRRPSQGMTDMTSAVFIDLDQHNADIRAKRTTLRLVRDGLANTALIVEQAGKPGRFGSRQITRGESKEGAWATAEYSSFFAGGINHDNHAGPFGFHHGAMVAMCDGSVHLWNEDMAQDVMASLLTRDGSEIISDADWR